MSVICQTFIQNTWKKDLCSNCFKTLADHRYPNRERNSYILHSAAPYHAQKHWSGSQEWKYFLPDPEESNQTWSIPKAHRISRYERDKRSVSFLEEEPYVIGFGGEVYYLDGYDNDSDSDDGEFNLEKLDETDEDRAITKITKENTRFNTYISEKEARKQSRYESAYSKPVTRTDDTYEIAKNRYNSKSDRRNRDSTSYDAGSLYKAYYLPRVSIGPYGSVHNGLSHYGSTNNLDVQLPKRPRQNSGDRPASSALELTFDMRRERQKSGDKVSKLEGLASTKNPNQIVYTQHNQLVNGEAENARSSPLMANNLPRIGSFDCIPSARSDYKAERESLSRESESRIPNKVLEKCREGINTVSGRQMRKNRESLDGLVLDEPKGGNDCNKLNDCTNANNILSRQTVLNGSPHPSSHSDTSLPESPSRSNAEAEDEDLPSQRDIYAKEDRQQPIGQEEVPTIPPCEEYASDFPEQNSVPDANCAKPNKSEFPSEQGVPPQQPLHYAVSDPISNSPPTNHYAESWIAVETSQSNHNGKHSANRETRLAALAVELEQARHSESGQRQELESPARGEEQRDKSVHQTQKCASETKEESHKNKKSKFSLKKFLKRGKDNDGDANTCSKSSKGGEYDRSTLRLKIVHPMDMIEAHGFNHPPHADNIGSETSGSLQDVRSIEDNDQGSKQHTSTLSRGRKSDRPSKPPPPPKCQRTPSMLATDYVDLTVPITNLAQQNNEAMPHVVENHYDVPKNIVRKSESANKPLCADEDKKAETPMASPDETPNSKPADKPVTSDAEMNGDIARSPTGRKETNGTTESKTEALNSGEMTNDAPNFPPESPQPNSCESKKQPDNTDANNKQTQKAWITLEHSYAVVTAANHEVLARFLDTAAEERGQQLWKPESASLQWVDFELSADSPVKVLGDKIAVNATFRHGLRTDVTLLVANEHLYPVPCGKAESTYPVLGYFVDDFPHYILSEEQLPIAAGTLSTVHILQRAELDTFEWYCSSMAMDDNLIAERTFVILQLIHLLKVLKSRNIQDVPDVCNTFLTRTTNEEMSKLILLVDTTSTNNVEKISLCQFALSLIKRIFQVNPEEDASSCIYNVPPEYKKVFSAVIRLLNQEKPFSLQQTQCFVEYALWSPATVLQNCKKNLREMDVTLQRWLDTERAKCLRSVVRTLCRANVVTFLTLYDEYHANFLLKTSVRSLREVAMKS